MENHSHIHHEMHQSSNFKLAVSATTHCLIGCGLGEVSGVIVGTLLGLSFTISLTIGVVAGLIFGYILGIFPLIRAKMIFTDAAKVVITTETLSILVMETAEVLTEVYFPGMRYAGLNDLTFWLGLISALILGFAAAFPVNLYLVKRGVRHQH